MKYKFRIKDIIIEVEYALIIIMIVVTISKRARDYMEMYFACLLFVMFHELMHIIFGTMIGKRLGKVTFTISGLSAGFKYDSKIKNKAEEAKEMAVFLSGPLSNVILAMLFKDVKFVYEINVAIAIINMIPIPPLDGYNIIEKILFICGLKDGKTKKSILKIIVYLAGLCILLLAIFSIVYLKTFNVAFFFAYILFININR